MITIYSPNEDDFSNYGLGILYPFSCVIREIAGGLYELEMEHPIDNDLRWTLIGPECIIKAPAPLRESPLYEAEAWQQSGNVTVPVTRGLYKVKDGKNPKLYKKANKNSKKLANLEPGDEMTRISTSGKFSRVILRKGGKTGYVRTAYIEFIRNVTDNVKKSRTITRNGISVVPSRDQYFRVKTVEPNTETGIVTVTAQQVFYDMHGNLINVTWETKETNANAAISYMESKLLYAENDFEFTNYDLTNTISGDWSFKSPVEFLLDPDDGLIPQTRDMIVRDGWDVYILPDNVRDTGVTVRRGKNLIGVTTHTDYTNVVTRIIPVGRAKNGGDLLLTGTTYVDSSHINDYPRVYAKRVEYDVSIVDKDPDNVTTFTNVTSARNKLRSLAQRDINAGCDIPDYNMEVNFAYLQYAEGYEDYANLQSIHLYDTVTVIDELIGLKAETRVVEYEWDCLKEQYTNIVLGNIKSIKPTVYSYNMPNGGISGTKIAVNSIRGDKLMPDSIYARNIRAGAVVADAMATDTFTANTAFVEAMNAHSINAVEADINSITSATIATNTLAAAFANLFEIVANNIRAGTVTTDALDAVMASLVSASVGVLDVGFEHVKDLVADQSIIRAGEADALYIDRLSVTSANMVNAVISRLILVDDSGTDPAYYAVNVGSDGTISLEEVELSQEEIDAGQTSDGKPILTDTIVADDINGENIYGVNAIVATILTDALNAGQITATEALLASARIPALYTTAIAALGDTLTFSANETIQFLLGVANNVNAWFTFGANGLEVRKADSKWHTVTAAEGYYIDHDEIIGHVGAFERERLIVRGLQIGDITVRATGSNNTGGWAWSD